MFVVKGYCIRVCYVMWGMRGMKDEEYIAQMSWHVAFLKTNLY